MVETILFINRSASRCGACGQNADPSEKTHDTVWGWSDTTKGCGVRWTHLSSDYNDHNGLYAGIRRMRPDLIPAFTALDASECASKDPQ